MNRPHFVEYSRKLVDRVPAFGQCSFLINECQSLNPISFDNYFFDFNHELRIPEIDCHVQCYRHDVPLNIDVAIKHRMQEG